jgi:hypothetical protein
MAGSTAEGGSGTHDSDRRAELWRAVEREGRSPEKSKGEEIRRVVIAAQSDRYRSNGEQEPPHTQSHREPPPAVAEATSLPCANYKNIARIAKHFVEITTSSETRVNFMGD